MLYYCKLAPSGSSQRKILNIWFTHWRNNNNNQWMAWNIWMFQVARIWFPAIHKSRKRPKEDPRTMPINMWWILLFPTAGESLCIWEIRHRVMLFAVSSFTHWQGTWWWWMLLQVRQFSCNMLCSYSIRMPRHGRMLLWLKLLPQVVKDVKNHNYDAASGAHLHYSHSVSPHSSGCKAIIIYWWASVWISVPHLAGKFDAGITQSSRHLMLR